jgi:hypothetical protein
MNVAGFFRGAFWLARPGRVGPISDNWGRERGLPIDRWYIERFLESNAGDIRGRVLEVMDHAYTKRFGAGVTASTVLDVDVRNPNATLTADLGEPESLPAERPFGGRFGGDRTSVTPYGNARTSMAFLVGLPAEELSERELAAGHWAFPTLVTVRAAKG